MIDGGTSYLRRNVNKEPYEELSVYNTDDFELVREAFCWGTRGLNGDQPLMYKPLKELDTSHIEAILRTQKQICVEFRELFEKELEWREVKRCLATGKPCGTDTRAVNDPCLCGNCETITFDNLISSRTKKSIVIKGI